ncbi:MAG TPA: hypothetical protein VMV53_07545 [Acidimicrobiales bacterium]|nr:hypothetical protein [Acidimicrobiales bacterium]
MIAIVLLPGKSALVTSMVTAFSKLAASTLDVFVPPTRVPFTVTLAQLSAARSRVPPWGIPVTSNVLVKVTDSAGALPGVPGEVPTHDVTSGAQIHDAPEMFAVQAEFGHSTTAGLVPDPLVAIHVASVT